MLKELRELWRGTTAGEKLAWVSTYLGLLAAATFGWVKLEERRLAQELEARIAGEAKGIMETLGVVRAWAGLSPLEDYGFGADGVEPLEARVLRMEWGAEVRREEDLYCRVGDRVLRVRGEDPNKPSILAKLDRDGAKCGRK